MTKIKRNDSGIVIPYTLPEEYRNLDGASVEFLLENKRSTALVAKGEAVIVDQAAGHLAYTLAEGETLGAGIHIGEFQVTYADGTFLSFPRSGYLEVDIQRNIDGGRALESEERIAVKVSLIDEKFDAMAAENAVFKGEVGAQIAAIEDETAEWRESVADDVLADVYEQVDVDRVSNTEVREARGGEATLGAKIAKVDSQLAQTVSKQYVDESLINYKVADKAVGRNQLSDRFLAQFNYLTRSTDLNTLTKDGWFVVTDALNKPTQINDTAILENVSFTPQSQNVRWVFQKIYDFNKPSIMYIRKLDFQNSSATTPWERWDLNLTTSASRFSNKPLICLGDSITADGGSQSSYPTLIANIGGFTVTNSGSGGATWQKDGNSSNDAISIVHKSSTIDFKNYDYVTIFAGTNDYGKDYGVGRPIGNLDDDGENTLHGAINNTIKNILTSNPNTKIALIAPMWRRRESSGDNKDSDYHPNQLGFFLRDYVEAIIESAKKHHLPVLNLYDECSINIYNHATYLYDGLHPNLKGRELLARKIFNFIESVY